MFIICVAICLGIFILAALIVLIILVSRNNVQKAARPDFSRESDPYVSLQQGFQEPSAPSHDNRTINLRSLNDQPHYVMQAGTPGSNSSLADIPRISEAAKTVGLFNNDSSDSDRLMMQNPRRSCHAVIQYEENNRIAMYEMYEDTVLLGRDPAICDIALQGNKNSKVSRCHALLRYTDNMLYISDLNSRNKTFLNNSEVDGKARIPGDCTVVLGDAPVKIKLIK